MASAPTLSAMDVGGQNIETAAREPMPGSAGRLALLRWAMRLVHELHQLPPNAARRQRRLLTLLCQHFNADSGTTCALLPERLGASVGCQHVSQIAFEPQRRGPRLWVGDLNHILDAATMADIQQRLGEAPSVWQRVPDDVVHALTDQSDGVSKVPIRAFSLIPLSDGRHSLLELQRSPIAGRFSADELAVIALIHQECAWACDASPTVGASIVPGLSPRERETLEHLLAGASEKEVAASLRRSRHTVHSYVKRIYRQLGVSSRAELLAIFVDTAGRDTGPDQETDVLPIGET